ncbi:hypothetical protein PUN28_011129 [Cardiocondyla obscurior]|uniref:Gustatory receptor n=1 Tax=Cardiocondyla obscurior TaxID=286306 RepID=A0AAW2FQ65_9HYME
MYLLQIMKQVHLELCKVSKLMCSAFGVQIAWEIGVVMLNIIQTLYNFYNRYIVRTSRSSTIADTIMAIILCFINILKIFILSRVCKNATEEGNKTVELIHTTNGCNTDIETQEEMQQFGIQILQSPVIFYVFGLRMDNHILSMMLSTLTTYMVIIVQVSNSLESNSDITDIHF